MDYGWIDVLSTSQGGPARDSPLEVTHGTIRQHPADVRTISGDVLRTFSGRIFTEWDSCKQQRNYYKSIIWIYQNKWNLIRGRCINIHTYKFWYIPTASINTGRSEAVLVKHLPAFIFINILRIIQTTSCNIIEKKLRRKKIHFWLLVNIPLQEHNASDSPNLDDWIVCCCHLSGRLVS